MWKSGENFDYLIILGLRKVNEWDWNKGGRIDRRYYNDGLVMKMVM